MLRLRKWSPLFVNIHLFQISALKCFTEKMSNKESMISLVSVIHLSILLHDTGFPNFPHSSFWSEFRFYIWPFHHLANQSLGNLALNDTALRQHAKITCQKKTKNSIKALSLYLQLSDKSTKYDLVNSPVPQDNCGISTKLYTRLIKNEENIHYLIWEH